MGKVKIILIKPITAKLAFVKMIKDCTGFMLRESKDICDSLHINGIVEIDVNDIQYLIKELEPFKDSVSLHYPNDRVRKILTVGIGSHEDYAQFLSEVLFYEISSKKVDEGINMMEDILLKLSKEQLQEIFDNYESNRVNGKSAIR